eukprot:EG_transcript_33684
MFTGFSSLSSYLANLGFLRGCKIKLINFLFVSCGNFLCTIQMSACLQNVPETKRTQGPHHTTPHHIRTCNTLTNPPKTLSPAKWCAVERSFSPLLTAKLFGHLSMDSFTTKAIWVQMLCLQNFQPNVPIHQTTKHAEPFG